MKKTCRRKEESSSLRPILSVLGWLATPRYLEVLALGCLTLPRSPSLLWRSSEALGDPIKSDSNGRELVRQRSRCGRGAKPGQDPSSNGIACWSVAPRRLGLSSRRSDPDAAPLPLAAHRALYSSPLASLEPSLPERPLNKQSCLSSTMEPLEICDLRDPGRPLWAGVDQPSDRHLTRQHVVGLRLFIAFIGVEQPGAISAQRQQHPELESDAIVQLSSCLSQSHTATVDALTIVYCTSQLLFFRDSQPVFGKFQGCHGHAVVRFPTKQMHR